MAATRWALTVLLALLVLLGPAGLAAHHHCAAHDESHCVACLLWATCLGAVPALFIVPAAPVLRSRLAPTACLIPPNNYFRPYSARAPPV